MQHFVEKMKEFDIIHPLYFLEKQYKNLFIYLLFMGIFIKISTNHKP